MVRVARGFHFSLIAARFSLLDSPRSAVGFSGGCLYRMNSCILFAQAAPAAPTSVTFQFLSILGLFYLTVITPGPDFLAVVQASLNRGLKTGLATALGIGCGLLFHCTYSVLGVAWLIKQYPFVFSIIRILGGLYIGYLGIQSLRSKSIANLDENSEESKEQSILSRGGFVTGLLVNLLNAKAMIWFIVFFSSVIPESFGLSLRALFALCSLIGAIVIFSLLALFISQRVVRTTLQKMGRAVNIIIGLAFLFIAADILYGLFNSPDPKPQPEPAAQQSVYQEMSPKNIFSNSPALFSQECSSTRFRALR